METKNIYQKLLEAQKEIGAIKKDSDNPFFKSKYFDINAILAVVKPVLNKHGLLLTQAIKTKFGESNEPTFHTESIGIETKIVDAETKEEVSAICAIPQISDPQKQGSAITYFRRYALQSLLALEAEDDDANEASKPEKKTKVEAVDTNNPPF
jgi:hypothetical protein